MSRMLIAGAAAVDVSPVTPQFLYGYPQQIIACFRSVFEALHDLDGCSQADADGSQDEEDGDLHKAGHAAGVDAQGRYG